LLNESWAIFRYLEASLLGQQKHCAAYLAQLERDADINRVKCVLNSEYVRGHRIDHAFDTLVYTEKPF
jgi:hypothetical protein